MASSRLQYELTQADYDALFRFQATTPGQLKGYNRGRWVVSGYCIFLAGLNFLGDSPVWWWPLVIMVPSYLLIARISQWGEIRRLRYIRNDPDGKHLGLATLQFENDKLVYTAPDGTYVHNVSEISDIGETDTHYFLSMGTETAIVPKTAPGAEPFISELRQRSEKPIGMVVTVPG